MTSSRNVFLLWLLYAILAIGMQFANGVYAGAWGDSPDEPGHFLNGVMVFDYLKAGAPEHPLGYAERYYAHYPKIALGHWPPLFAIVAAAWFFAAPVSYSSAMTLIALLAAAVATLLAKEASRRLPLWLAASGGAIWLALPLVRRSSDAFMAEILVTLCTFTAVLAFADFLDSAAARDSLRFGVWSALALLAKGTGIALAILPPVAILLAARWGLLRTRTIWIAPLVVLAVAGPWYAFAPGALHERVDPYGGIRYVEGRVGESWAVLFGNLGPALLSLAVIGLAVAIRRVRLDPRWAACVALLPANLLLRSAVSTWEGRHLILILPVCLLLALTGYDWLEHRVPWRALFRVAALAAVLLHVHARWPVRGRLPGFAEAASFFVQQNAPKSSVLISGSSSAEGAFICEVAIRDRRPGHKVIRATKFLARARFLGDDYHLLYQTPDELAEALRTSQIATVVTEVPRERAMPHESLLADYLRSHSGEWRLAGIFHDRAAVYVRH